jgi:hypothetical protein
MKLVSQLTIVLAFVAIGANAKHDKAEKGEDAENLEVTEDDLVENHMIYVETIVPSKAPTVDVHLHGQLLIIQTNPDEEEVISPQHPDSYYAPVDPYDHQETNFNPAYYSVAIIFAIAAIFYYAARRGSLDPYLPAALLNCMKSKKDKEAWLQTPKSSSSTAIANQAAVVSL